MRDALGAFTDVANQTRGVADDQPMRWHIARDDTACADQRPFANRDATDDGRVCAERGAAPDARLAQRPIACRFETAVGVDRARLEVICKAHMRTDKHAILNRHAVKHRDVILDLDVVADLHARVYIHALADDTIFADARALADVRLMPDRAALADLRLRRHICRRVNLHMRDYRGRPSL